jgi:beta-glucosidase
MTRPLLAPALGVCTVLLLLQAAAQDQPQPQPAAWMNISQGFEQRARQLVAALTLEEKLGQLNSRTDAITRLNLPAFDWWTGCAHGMADFSQQGATIFPMPLALAAAFDQRLMAEVSCHSCCRADRREPSLCRLYHPVRAVFFNVL